MHPKNAPNSNVFFGFSVGKRRQFRSSRFAAQATDRISNDIPDGPLTDLTLLVFRQVFVAERMWGLYGSYTIGTTSGYSFYLTTLVLEF